MYQDFQDEGKKNIQEKMLLKSGIEIQNIQPSCIQYPLHICDC